MDKFSEKLCLALKNVHALAAEVGMTTFLEGETAFLLTLKQRGAAPATPSELSAELGVTKGRITAIVNALTRKGMVRLEKMDCDGRKVNVRITDAGMAYVDGKLEKIDEFMEIFIAEVGREKAEELTDIIESVTGTMLEKAKK